MNGSLHDEAWLQLALQFGQSAGFEKTSLDEPPAWRNREALDGMGAAGKEVLEAWVERVWAGELPEAIDGTYTIELDVPVADGEPRRLRAMARRLDEGAVCWVVGAAADFTAQCAGQAAIARLHEVDCLRDEFLGVLAHELRNPLSPILTSAQLLRRRGLERPELLGSA